MSFNQFAVRFIFGIFALLALIGIFNRIVDPFWYYRDIEIKGFNAVKIKFSRYERHVKPSLLVREQPEAIIMGRSYSEQGFDPTNPLFTDYGRLKSMNFALMGASWDMVECEFEFAVSHAHIKRILIDLPPGDLPLANCAKDFSSIGQVSTMQFLLSDTALQASIDTILAQKHKMPSHTREGMYFPSQGNSPGGYRFQEYFSNKIHELRQSKKDVQCLKPTDTSNTTDILTSGKALDLSGLRRMIKIAQDHNIELIMAVPPRHAYLLELTRQCGEQNANWQAMKQISELIDAESARGGQIRAYQFYGYNIITAEAVGATPAIYWYDPEHFSVETGNMMLSDMFGGSSPRLGRQLTSASINADYQDFLLGRIGYLERHPDFQSDMKKLFPPDMPELDN